MAKKCDHLKDNRRLCSRQREKKGAFSPPKSLCWDQWSLFSSRRLFEVCLHASTVLNCVLELKLASENIYVTLISWGCPSCNSGMIQDVHVAQSSLHGELNWGNPMGFPRTARYGELLPDSELGDSFNLTGSPKKVNDSFSCRRV